MIKKASAVILFIFLCPYVFCESLILQSYKQRFSAADIPAKVQILESASGDRAMNDYIGQLYEHALQFALDNSRFLKNDQSIIRIINIAINGLRNISFTESLDVLWKLFFEYQDLPIGAEILITMGKLGKGNHLIIDNVNNFLIEQNLIFRSGISVNYAMISACITAMMELGDSSSYPALFAVLYSGFPEVIVFEAQGALDLIPGNYQRFLYDAISEGVPDEKFAAFRAGINSERLNLSERGQLAELALEQSLVSDRENADLTAMRYAAVLALTQLRWTRANQLAISHYYRVLADSQQHIVSKQRFLEAIDLLGAVGNSDAALVLVLQLGLINARMERTGEYDEEITLAIVRSLGRIGDKAAYNHLLNVGNLSYPENIQVTAREAIDRLRW